MRIDEKKEGVLVISFTREHVSWWQADGNVDVTFGAHNGPPEGILVPRDGVGPKADRVHQPPARTTGPITLRFSADEANRHDLSAAHRLALAVLCGDDEGGKILADMVLMGDAQ